MAEKGLASRFKAAISKDGGTGPASPGAGAEVDARRARFVVSEGRLFDDLVAMVTDIGGIEATRGDGYLHLGRDSRRVTLQRNPAADGLDVAFDGAPAGQTLTLVDEAWHVDSGLRRVALFDAGLEELLVDGLGLPRPEAPEEAEITSPIEQVEVASATTPPADDDGQVILRDVKLDKSGSSAKPGAAGLPREASALRNDTGKKDKTHGPPGSQVREIPKW
jgi:hypothetical protein